MAFQIPWFRITEVEREVAGTSPKALAEELYQKAVNDEEYLHDLAKLGAYKVALEAGHRARTVTKYGRPPEEQQAAVQRSVQSTPNQPRSAAVGANNSAKVQFFLEQWCEDGVALAKHTGDSVSKLAGKARTEAVGSLAKANFLNWLASKTGPHQRVGDAVAPHTAYQAWQDCYDEAKEAIG
jgi:hypothetical protein